jgi:hypothetical protein
MAGPIRKVDSCSIERHGVSYGWDHRQLASLLFSCPVPA